MSDFDLYESEIEDLYRPKEEPKVVLTVEEAKRLHDCAMFFWCDYEGTQYFTDDDKRFLTDMKERIAKAEGKK